MSETLRLPAEATYAAELAALAVDDADRRPPGWALSPRRVVTYLMGGTAQMAPRSAPNMSATGG